MYKFKHNLKKLFIIAAVIIVCVLLCKFGINVFKSQKSDLDSISAVRAELNDIANKEYTLDLEIISIEIDPDESERFINTYKGSELARERMWTDELLDNLTAVKAIYRTEYDHSKTFIDDGYTEQYFYLIKDNSSEAWEIIDSSGTYISNDTTDDNSVEETNSLHNDDAALDKNDLDTVEQTPTLYAYDDREKCLTIDLKNIGEALEMPENSEMAEILRLDDLTNSSSDISSLGKLKNVRQIYINGTVDDLGFTENYKDLTDVYIEHFCGKLSGLNENPSVKKVSIANSQIEIESIDKWSGLEEIDISNSDVIVSGNYSGFGRLKRFSAVCSCFENNDLSFAENAPELTEFVYSPLKNIGLQNYTKLAFCNELKALSLSGSITDLNFLTELNKLEELTVITENYLELSPLYENNSLNTAVISCTGYDSDGKTALIEKFPQCNWTIEKHDKIF